MKITYIGGLPVFSFNKFHVIGKVFIPLLFKGMTSMACKNFSPYVNLILAIYSLRFHSPVIVTYLHFFKHFIILCFPRCFVSLFPLTGVLGLSLFPLPFCFSHLFSYLSTPSSASILCVTTCVVPE